MPGTSTHTCGGCTVTWTALGACHCSGCHATFSGITAFDAHRRRFSCLDPSSVGLEPDAGVWRWAGADQRFAA